MKEEDATDDKDTSTEMTASDPDPVQVGAEAEAAADSELETPDSATDASDEQESAAKSAQTGEDGEPEPAAPKTDEPADAPRARRSWFGLFNLLLILVLAGAVGYYWWLEQQARKQYEATIADLRAEIAARAGSSRVDTLAGNLDSLRGDFGAQQKQIDTINVEQESLKQASEKLYELFGRDKNDWQLAEVEYLMRVAQHKLILQDDFEGAAITLQAASDKIALTGDPGLLPVRVKISDEIADLKTRKRADLVGMTLILAQLGRQVRVLEPGFELRVDTTAPTMPAVAGEQDWLERLRAFIDSLVEVRIESTEPTEIEANVADVAETLADNLKLARWAVLERDAAQYAELIDQSLRLFREFYDLDNAANNDFYRQLQELQKMQLKPEKPDIGGSLRELQRILSQRENAPVDEEGESADG